MKGDASLLSAPYGHACAECVRSKCKCIIRHAGGPCERCNRTNKECRPAETVRRRKPRKPVVSKKASTRLEEKLDDLVSLLQAREEPSTVIPSLQSTPDGTILMKVNTTTTNQSEMNSVLSSSNSHIRNVPILESATTDVTSFSHSLPPFTFRDVDEPSPVEAEENLVNFKTCKSKYFPFVYIPSTTSAQHLRQEWPFLWLSIMTVGSKSTSQQQVLGSKIRQMIAQEMVVQSEKNLDLLLGLLTFIGWSHYQIHDKPFLATFTHLAMSLVFDLGLNKPPKDAHVVFSLCQKPSTPRTMEERRAVLGCFLITSIMSLVLQRIDALRWTPHMDECLQILDQTKECPNDEILVQQVKLQLIVERLALSTPSKGAVEDTGHREPGSFYLENLQSQLQTLKTSLLIGSSNDVVLLHLYSTELEVAFLPPFRQTNPVPIQQRRSLNAGFESVKHWFDVFFTITPAAYIGFSFPIFLQMARCLTTLYRLTSLKDQTCDEDGVAKTADAILISNRVINNLEQVSILNGLENCESSEGDVFSRAAKMVRSFQAEWEAKLCTEDPVPPIIPTPQNVNEISVPDAFVGDFSDNDWLTDLVLFPSY